MIHLDDLDKIWNHSQFDKHFELIQSGGYKNLHQIAGATGAHTNETTVAPVTSNVEAPTGLSVATWIVIVILVLACIGGIGWFFFSSKVNYDDF